MDSDLLSAENFTHRMMDPVFPPDYSCFDDNLSSSNVTVERWRSYDSAGVRLSTAIVLLLFVLIGLPCNLLIIVSMLWKKLYRQPAHILLLSLAINDFLMCVTYIPINIISAFAGEFIFGTSDVARCHVCQISIIFVIFAVFNLHVIALLSLDRFLFIKVPLYYNRVVTVKTTVAAVIITSIFSIIIAIPPLFGFGEIRFTSSVSTCTLYLLGSTQLTENVYFEVFSIAEAFAIPIPLLIITNVWIICIIRKQMKKMHETRTSMEQKGKIGKYRLNIKQKLNRPKNKRQLRVIRIYAAFILSNLITWTPNVLNTAVILVWIYYPFFFVPAPFFVSNYLFFVSQVVVHPLIQATMIPDIRNLFTGLCRKRMRERSFSVDRNCCACCDVLAAAILPAAGTTFVQGNSVYSKRGTLEQRSLEQGTLSLSITTTSPAQGFPSSLASMELSSPQVQDSIKGLSAA